jgi:D-amino-acid oxidase
MSPEVDAIVIGAGVVGLTTAICAAESGMRVRILAERPPQETTSALAAALVGPNFAPPGDVTRRWQEETERRLTARAGIAGVNVLDGVFAARPRGAMPPFADEAPGFRLCAPAELPEGFGSGFWASVPVVDMPPYLEHLFDEFTALGGQFEQRGVQSLDEALAIAPRVANCSGLGARALAGDTGVQPVRGVKLVVENPGLDTFFLEAPFGPIFSSFLPHGDRVVLGGTHSDSTSTEPDEREAAEILRRCAAVEPRLAGARVVEHRVGLRPGRAAPRLEAEPSGEAVVVHNYGHAGVGVMLSWGCARDAAALLAGGSPPVPDADEGQGP